MYNAVPCERKSCSRETWRNCGKKYICGTNKSGQRVMLEFERALEEFGYEYLLVPFIHGRAMQINVRRTWRCREKIVYVYMNPL